MIVGVVPELAVELELLLENSRESSRKQKREILRTSNLVGPGGLGPGQPGKTPGERREKC